MNSVEAGGSVAYRIAETPQQGKASISPAATSDRACTSRGNIKAPPRAATNRHGGADRESDGTTSMATASVFTRSHICPAAPGGRSR